MTRVTKRVMSTEEAREYILGEDSFDEDAYDLEHIKMLCRVSKKLADSANTPCFRRNLAATVAKYIDNHRDTKYADQLNELNAIYSQLISF